MTRLRVLLSAYACEPERGSEPGVGWNLARAVARHHDVWVLTRANNRPAIEAALAREPLPGFRVVYHDLPTWLRRWKRGGLGIQLYYYGWQCSLPPLVRRLHREIGFQLVHHVTFVRYWTPAGVAALELPFVWGPVGGGESGPPELHAALSPRGRLLERARDLVRGVGERDPLVRATARRADLALATTAETAARLRPLRPGRIELFSQLGLPDGELDELAALGAPGAAADEPPAGGLRFVSAGNLLHWKGFELGLRAFARAALPDASYEIVGDGPERARLEALAAELGVSDRVRFHGRLPRMETLRTMAAGHALVHPSLHDSGGGVCLEAMALGRPVVCLALGGPAMQVTPETGVLVPAATPDATVAGLADALRRLAERPRWRRELGRRAQERARRRFSWTVRGDELARFYEQLTAERATGEEARGA